MIWWQGDSGQNPLVLDGINGGAIFGYEGENAQGQVADANFDNRGTSVFRDWAIFGDDGNNTTFGSTGIMTQIGLARTNWTKYTADSNTLVDGDNAAGSVVTQLQTAHDGLFLHTDEDNSDPGIELIVDFVSVTAFNWVEIIGCYNGSSTHSVGIMLYNWTNSGWDTFSSFQDSFCDLADANEFVLDNESFIVHDDTNYIGTGGDAGKVRVKMRHTDSVIAIHTLHLDVVALWQ